MKRERSRREEGRNEEERNGRVIRKHKEYKERGGKMTKGRRKEG